MFEKNIWAQAERSHASSLNDLLGYEKVMDHQEIWPTYSHSNKKLFEGILILCIWSPASDVKLSSEIMISKLDREVQSSQLEYLEITTQFSRLFPYDWKYTIALLVQSDLVPD